jgi:uncharacterized protein (TIGR02145 family)
MRKLILTTAAVAAVLCLAGCSKKPAQEPASETQTATEIDTVTGMLTDKRDKQTYRTVVIGGNRWMAENLNYKTDSSWCYNNADSNCVKYGRMYNWEASMVACPEGWHLPSREEWDSLGQAVGGRGRKEFDFDSAVSRSGADKKLSAKSFEKSDTSMNAIGKRWTPINNPTDWSGAGKKLKARSGWFLTIYQNGNGTDDYGFSALPGGRRYGPKTFIDGANHGDGSYWWTAANDGNYEAHSRYILSINDGLYEDSYNMDFGFSVRCVRNGSGATEEKRKKEYEQYLQLIAEKRKEREQKIEELSVNKEPELEQGEEPEQQSDQMEKDAEREKKEEAQRIEKLSAYFTDSRDGRKYRAVKIGKYKWMAENLNHEPKSGGSWCQNNEDYYCGKYGRLYDWNTAKTVCPAGWRLPSRKEWDNLAAATGGRKGSGSDKGTVEWDGVSVELRSKSGWDPRFWVYWTDDYGFSALPNGIRNSDGTFCHIALDGEAKWWTATESGGDAFTRWAGYYGYNMREYKINKNDALPVRCVSGNP